MWTDWLMDKLSNLNRCSTGLLQMIQKARGQGANWITYAQIIMSILCKFIIQQTINQVIFFQLKFVSIIKLLSGNCHFYPNFNKIKCFGTLQMSTPVLTVYLHGNNVTCTTSVNMNNFWWLSLWAKVLLHRKETTIAKT
jgi:hypothetical protein